MAIPKSACGPEASSSMVSAMVVTTPGPSCRRPHSSVACISGTIGTGSVIGSDPGSPAGRDTMLLSSSLSQEVGRK